uniref:Uncharacterized protein n=1 Tax=Anguilla anguilla TaxID=7936 RepID=A0A0E9U5K1_ANGAN
MCTTEDRCSKGPVSGLDSMPMMPVMFHRVAMAMEDDMFCLCIS